MDYLIVLERTIIFYVLITLLYRFMGKREVGQLGVIDLIVSILIAELAAMSIDKRQDSIFIAIIPIVLLGLIQIGLSFISLKSKKIRDIFDGSPSVIVSKGKINFKEMVKQRYNLDDFLTQLREKNVKSIEEIDYAILEPSGKLSVFRKEEHKFDELPLPLILDGNLDKNTLKRINKDKNWLDNVLKDENLTVKDIFYAYYRENNLYIIRKSDLNKEKN